MGSPGEVDTRGKTLVLFDGVCNLCNNTVRFIIKRDPAGRFCFASLQSPVAISILTKFGLDPNAADTIVVVDEGRALFRSDAVLTIMQRLEGIWSVMTALRIYPRPWRDGLYNIVARRRYGFFGRSDKCIVPNDELRSRFLAW
jgi:predicted DCC family thiol-disulfide oxidoreductase YuxK